MMMMINDDDNINDNDDGDDNERSTLEDLSRDPEMVHIRRFMAAKNDSYKSADNQTIIINPPTIKL